MKARTNAYKIRKIGCLTVVVAAALNCRNSSSDTPYRAAEPLASATPSAIQTAAARVADHAPVPPSVPSHAPLSGVPDQGSILVRLQKAGLDPKEVRAFFDKLKTSASTGNADGLCAAVSYPIVVGSGKAGLKVKDAAACKSHSAAIFTPRVISAINKQGFENLFTNSKGVMIGDGEVWFDGVCDDKACAHSVVQIITINE